MNAWEEFYITFIKEGILQIWTFLLPILIPATIFGLKKVLGKFDIDIWQWKFEYHQDNKDTLKNSNMVTQSDDILATTAAVSSIDSAVKLQKGEQIKCEDKLVGNSEATENNGLVTTCRKSLSTTAPLSESIVATGTNIPNDKTENMFLSDHPITMTSRRKKELNIVLLGKTGEGKSSTANTIIGCNAFEMSTDKGSKTKEVSMELAEIDGVTIKIVDTPGLCDTHDKQEVTLQNIYNAMTMCPSGFDALIYVISYNGRFTNEDVRTLDILRQSFGEQFLNYCIIVLTHGVNFDLDGNQSVEQWCKQQKNVKDFTEAFELCKERIVLFYNKVYQKDALKQKNCVKQLLEMIQQFPGQYKNDDFKKCKIERDKLMLEGKLPHLTLEIEGKISLLKTELKKASKDIQHLDDSVIGKLQQRASTVITEIQKKQGKTGLLKTYLDAALLIARQIKQLSDKKENVLELLEEIENLTEKLKNPPDRKKMYFKYALGAAGTLVLCSISLAVPVVGVITAGVEIVSAVASTGAAVGTAINTYKDRKNYDSDVTKYNRASELLLEKKKKLNILSSK